MKKVLYDILRPGVEVAIKLLAEGGGTLSGTVGAFSGDRVCIALRKRLPSGSAVQVDAGKITVLGEVVGSTVESDSYVTHFAVRHWFATPGTEAAESITAERRMQAPMETNPIASLRESVSKIETVFGRLMHVALAAQLSNDLAAGNTTPFRAAVNEVHREIFAQWLSMRLQEQRLDLEAYISSLRGHRRQLLKSWTAIAGDLDLVPAGVAEHERALYTVEFRTHLDMIFNSMSVSTGTVGALKPATEPRR